MDCHFCQPTQQHRGSTSTHIFLWITEHSLPRFCIGSEHIGLCNFWRVRDQTTWLSLSSSSFSVRKHHFFHRHRFIALVYQQVGCSFSQSWSWCHWVGRAWCCRANRLNVGGAYVKGVWNMKLSRIPPIQIVLHSNKVLDILQHGLVRYNPCVLLAKCSTTLTSKMSCLPVFEKRGILNLTPTLSRFATVSDDRYPSERARVYWGWCNYTVQSQPDAIQELKLFHLHDAQVKNIVAFVYRFVKNLVCKLDTLCSEYVVTWVYNKILTNYYTITTWMERN